MTGKVSGEGDPIACDSTSSGSNSIGWRLREPRAQSLRSDDAVSSLISLLPQGLPRTRTGFRIQFSKSFTDFAVVILSLLTIYEEELGTSLLEFHLVLKSTYSSGIDLQLIRR